MISDALAGFELRPAAPPTGGESHEMDRKILAFNLDEYDGDFDLSEGYTFDKTGVTVSSTENWIVTQKGARDTLVTAFSAYTGINQVSDTDLPDMSDPDSFDLLTNPAFGHLGLVQK